ncbi:MAG: Holliday junction branch migration protein RuvA [Ruminococcaceae bacterium]|nr:Holliday junction branch migration protein RuvA [Oscillospiraceae bacterium]
MFYYLCGKLNMASGNDAVLDCGGVGYLLTVSGKTVAMLHSKVGSTVKLFTHMSVREDAVELFGFADEEELSVFKLLITVSGIGPKAAIAILTALTPSELNVAVASSDAKRISGAQGVGGKTAARVILELKDKLPKLLGAPVAGGDSYEELPSGVLTSSERDDAAAALAVLGYTRSEINAAFRKIDIGGCDMQEIVKRALSVLAK